MKKIILTGLLSLLFFSCENAISGINGLTIHSRANCVNNESISWELGKNWILDTVAFHYYSGKLQHRLETGWAETWRSAAVHWGEGKGGWSVVAYHYISYNNKDYYSIGNTTANNCNIYDGWWDYN